MLTAGVFAIIFFWSLLNQYIFKPRADVETVDLSFTPASGNFEAGDENVIDLLIKAPAGKGVSGIDISFFAQNGQILDVSNAIPVSGDQTVTFTEVLTDIANSGHRARKSAVAIQPDQKLPQLVRMQLIYQCLRSGESRLAIDKAKTEIVGNTVGDTYELSTFNDAVFNCSGGVVENRPAINARLMPSQQTVRVGKNFGYELIFDGQPAGKGVSAVDVSLNFDPSLIEVLSIGDLVEEDFRGINPPTAPVACRTDADCKICADLAGAHCVVGSCQNSVCDFTGRQPQLSPTPTVPVPTVIKATIPPVKISPPDLPPSTGQCTQLIKTWNNEIGKIRLSYVCIMPENSLPRAPHIGINFKANKVGQGSVQIASAKVTGNIPEFAYKVKTADAAFTIVGEGDDIPSPAESKLTLNLKLKFQGVESKPKKELNNMKVKVSVGDGGLKTPVSTYAEFTADDAGIWHGSAALDLKPGSGYKVLIKGPKHLQKKICDQIPQEQRERYAGTYACDRGKITIGRGQNNLDFSAVHNLTCDLPEQDGIVNAYDLSLVINLLDKEDADSVRLADLNLDGKVGAIDHSLCIAALSIKLDEQ